MSAPKVLSRAQFGNPILRAKTRPLSRQEILSKETKLLIDDMRYMLAKKKYGVGLAPPQVGYSLSMAIIEIKPTKTRPKLPKKKWVSLVIINPSLIKTYGNRKQLYEGCISFADVFAKVPRYKKIRVRYYDENAKKHEKDFEGLLAHVIQHEIDHLNGILFVDRVKDKTSFITQAEYIKRIVKKKKERRAKNKERKTTG